MRIRAVLFDCDGVLVSTVRLHSEAFRKALLKVAPSFPIERLREDELNGLSTREKIQRLTATVGIPYSLHEAIWAEKQRITTEMIPAQIPYDLPRVEVVASLKHFGFKVACVSNAIRATTNQMLACAGFSGRFDLVLSNEDVARQKPAPDPYLLAMSRLGVQPQESLVIEDAPHGVESARRSGAHVLVLEQFGDLDAHSILRRIDRIQAGVLA